MISKFIIFKSLQIDIACKVLKCIKREITKHQPSKPCTPTDMADSPFSQPSTPTIDDLDTPTNTPQFPSFPQHPPPYKTPSDRIFSSVDLGFDVSDCDAILVTYAKKALEFPVLQQPEMGTTMTGRLSMASRSSLGGSMASLSGRRSSALPLATTAPSPSSRFPKVNMG